MAKEKISKEILEIVKKRQQWLIGLLTFFCIILFAVFTFSTFNEIRYRERILPGIKVGGIKMGGLTAEAAQKKLQTETDNLLANGLIFYYGTDKIIIQNSLQSLGDPDVNVDIIKYQIEPTIKQALAIGHSSLAFNNLKDQLQIMFTKYNLPIITDINYEEIQDVINRDMKQIIIPAKPAGINFTKDTPTITPAITGQIVDWPKIFSQLNNQAQSLQPIEISLTLIAERPAVNKEEADKNIVKLNLLLEQQPQITLKWNDGNKYIPWSDIKSWLEWEKIDGEVFVSLGTDSLNEYLSELSQEIDQPAYDAKFEVKNGRVIKFQSSQDGRNLNILESIQTIKNNFINKIYENELVITPKKAKVTTADVNDLGIREIIGVGTSDFSGSPKNRRHNIKVGADSLNGLLIKPGEEFSLIKALGDIDSEAGYLPELVIKGNETVPEYGGGLCQIGTTTFRATLASGLPVLARRNHSYRVRYYEPAGTDATIYDPAPDYKFLNNTSHYILIQTRIEGDQLIFEFWGTNDGRQIEQTEPKIYNITAPPPTKYIETLDLELGQQKCTESAHAGADAEFTYTVTYPDGEVKQKVFKSHYKPWGAVCLIGVEELSNTENPDETNNATNTDEILTN